MPDFVSQFPLLNPIQFVQEAEALPTKYHRRPNDREWYYDTIREWQYKQRYKQKIQQDDVIFVELHRSQYNSVKLYVLDCNGKVVADTGGYSPNFIIYDCGSSYSFRNGGSVSLTAHKWYFRFSDFGLEDGTYYLYCPVYYFEDVTIVQTKNWISEPLEVKANHPNTVYIEAWNETNRDDIIFQFGYDKASTGDFFFIPKFGYRVEGDIIKRQFKGNLVQFKEQDYEERVLSAHDYNTEKLYIGGLKGVPEYEMKKLNKAVRCDILYVEGRRVVPCDNAEFEADTDSYYPLFVAELEIQDYSKQDAISHASGATVDLYVEPDFPYFIHSMGLYNLFNTHKTIYGSDDRDDLIAQLNITAPNAWGLNGTFQFSDGQVQYVNALGENYTAGSSVILTDYVIASVNIPNDGDTIQFEVSGDYHGYGLGNGVDNPAYPNGTSLVPSKFTYGTAGDYEIYIFFAVGCSEFRNLAADQTGLLTNLTGGFNPFLSKVAIDGADFSAITFSLDLLENNRNSLTLLRVSDCQMSNIDYTVFANFPGVTGSISTRPWRLINYLSFSGSSLSQLIVEGILNSFYNNTMHQSIGTIILIQSPSVTISNPPATTNKASLQAAGWAVLP